MTLYCEKAVSCHIFQSSRSNIILMNNDIKNLKHAAMELTIGNICAKLDMFYCKFEEGVAF